MTSLPPDITAHFGLRNPRHIERLTLGTMNHNWRIDTASGSFAVKQILDIDAAQIVQSHRVMERLAQRGMPVPQPISTSTGDTVLRHNGHLYALLTWIAGDYLSNDQVDDTHAARLGHFLAETHHALEGLVTGDPVIDALPNAEDTASQLNGLLELIGDRSEPFDTDAKRLLHNRIRLLERFAHDRPPQSDLGPASGIHGDFQLFNILWHNDQVTGLLDWDRVRVAPRSTEVVRAATLIFGTNTQLIRRFVRAYQQRNPLPASAILSALEHRWWQELCSRWMLNRHYRDGLTTADHLLTLNEDRLVWWCEHRAELAAAFT